MSLYLVYLIQFIWLRWCTSIHTNIKQPLIGTQQCTRHYRLYRARVFINFNKLDRPSMIHAQRVTILDSGSRVRRSSLDRPVWTRLLASRLQRVKIELSLPQGTSTEKQVRSRSDKINEYNMRWGFEAPFILITNMFWFSKIDVNARYTTCSFHNRPVLYI